MAKINGNDGGNNKDLMQGLQAYYEAIKAKAAGKTDKPNKTTGAEANVPVGKQANVEHKELGEDLLTANMYPDLQLSFKNYKINPENVRLGGLNDLNQLSGLANVAKYGNLNTKNTVYTLKNEDFSIANMPKDIAQDITAPVEISKNIAFNEKFSKATDIDSYVDAASIYNTSLDEKTLAGLTGGAIQMQKLNELQSLA